MEEEHREEQTRESDGAPPAGSRRPLLHGVPAPEGSARPRGSDTARLAAGSSIRLHARARRTSLAARVSLPVVVFFIAAAAAVCLFARSLARDMILADLRADAVDAAYMGGVFGRLLLARRDLFPAGDTLREELGKFLDASGSGIVAMAVLDAAGAALASARRDSFPFDAAALRAAPRTGDGRQYDAGNVSISVDHIEDFDPGPVMRAAATLFSEEGERERVGTVVVVLRVDASLSRLNSFILPILGLFALLAPALGVVCWLSARRITTPLKHLAGDMQAIADGDYARRSSIRDDGETGIAAQAFNSMAERLRLARLNEAETSRLESDLAVARNIQNNLLPQQTPRVRGFDIHTAYRPAREIGGDYFDFLPVDGERMGLVVADASGKSIPAALVMSTTRAMLRFVAPGVRSASATLSQVNRILSVDIPRGVFVTMCYVILELRENTMLCASAGHNPLFIARRDGTVEQVNPGGIALGFDNGGIFDSSIREQRVALEPGDRVLLYTDGVVECANQESEEYSDRRLREFLRRNRDLSSRDFVGALLADLDRHRGTAEMRDDTTVVTFKML